MWFGGSFSFCFQCHTNAHAMLTWRTELLSKECGENPQWSLHVKLGRNWMNVLQQLLCSLEGRLDDPIQLAHSQFLWSLNKKTKHCLNCKGQMWFSEKCFHVFLPYVVTLWWPCPKLQQHRQKPSLTFWQNIWRHS